MVPMILFVFGVVVIQVAIAGRPWPIDLGSSSTEFMVGSLVADSECCIGIRLDATYNIAQIHATQFPVPNFDVAYNLFNMLQNSELTLQGRTCNNCTIVPTLAAQCPGRWLAVMRCSLTVFATNCENSTQIQFIEGVAAEQFAFNVVGLPLSPPIVSGSTGLAPCLFVFILALCLSL